METYESRKRNLMKEYVKDALSVCKGTSVNIAKMIVTAPIAPLSQGLHYSEGPAQDWRQPQKWYSEGQARKLIRRQITDNHDWLDPIRPSWY